MVKIKRKLRSEFGQGLCYNLGLFLAHEGKLHHLSAIGGPIMASTWFNGASDHLYDLQIPDNFPKELKEELKDFKDKVLDYGHGSGLMNDNVTDKDVLWALQEAKNLLRKIDEFHGIKTIKGEWE